MVVQLYFGATTTTTIPPWIIQNLYSNLQIVSKWNWFYADEHEIVSMRNLLDGLCACRYTETDVCMYMLCSLLKKNLSNNGCINCRESKIIVNMYVLLLLINVSSFSFALDSFSHFTPTATCQQHCYISTIDRPCNQSK